MKTECYKFEQKPVKIDTFREIEEGKIKKKIEKRKQNRRQLAEKNKEVKRKKERPKSKGREVVVGKTENFKQRI